MEFEFITGLRKNSKLLRLINENQLFVKNRSIKNKTYYVCNEKGCNVRICVEQERCYYMNEQLITHIHSDKKEYISELIVRNTIKEKCSEASILINTPNSVGNVRSIFNAEVTR